MEISARFDANLLDATWKIKCFHSFYLSNSLLTLPKSFSGWKSFYACLLGISKGIYNFHSFSKSTMIPAATYQQVRPTLSTHITLKPLPAHKPDSSDDLVFGKKRYISAITSDPIVTDHFCLYLNVLYFVEKSSGFQKIYAKSLLQRSAPLTHAFTQRRPIRLLKSNGKGLLVSLSSDNIISVWSLDPIVKKTDIVMEGHIVCLDVAFDNLAILFNDGSISVWNLDSGQLLSVFSIPSPHYASFQDSLRKNISISSEFVGIGLSKTGQYLIFAKDRFGLYHFQKCIPAEMHSPQDSFSASPTTFKISNSFVLTNSNQPDEVSVYRIQPDKNQHAINLFKSSTIAAPSKHINRLFEIEKCFDMSEAITLSIYGFHKTEASGDMPVACFDDDGGMLLGFVESDQDEKSRLLVWDFRVERIGNRYFEKVKLGESPIWLCYDVIQDRNLSS